MGSAGRRAGRRRAASRHRHLRAARRPAVARFHDVRPAAVVAARPRRTSSRRSPRRDAPAFRSRCVGAGTASPGGPRPRASCSTPRHARGRAVRGAEVATIGAGARLGDVYDALAPHGRTVVAGCGPTVGIAGLTLGGGLGVLGRRHGLTSDSVLGAARRAGRRTCRRLRRRAPRRPPVGAARRRRGRRRDVADLRTVPAPAATVLHATMARRGPRRRPQRLAEVGAARARRAGGEPPADRPQPGAPPSAHVFGVLLGPEEEAAQALSALADEAGAEPVSTVLRHLPYREANATWPSTAPARTTTRVRTGSPSRSSSAGRCRATPPPRSSSTCRPTTGRAGPRPGPHAVGRRLQPRRPAAPRRSPPRQRFLLKHEVAVPAPAGAAERDAALAWLEGSLGARAPVGVRRRLPELP